MPQAALPVNIERPLSLTDLNTTVNHEPRVLDVRLAEALGFPRPRKIRELIDRHREALERFGGITPHRGAKIGRGRPEGGHWLNKRQCLYLCTKSETANATEVTIQMVEVFDAYLAGERKQVEVKAHRRRRPGGYPPMFMEGSDLLGDLLSAVYAANQRVEKRQAVTFGQALEDVLMDQSERRRDRGHRPKGVIADWHEPRLHEWVGEMRGRA